MAQTGDYFQTYPGGFTRAVYQIMTSDLRNPIVLSWQVEPASQEMLTVTTTNQVTARREDLPIGVTSGVAQAQLIIQDEAVRTLLENRKSLGPHLSFILPGGARFDTAARETIAGLSVLCGLLTDPKKPQRRTLLAITEDPTAPFPPFIQLEEEKALGSQASSLELCTSLQPLMDRDARRFGVLFQLKLIEFERRD